MSLACHCHAAVANGGPAALRGTSEKACAAVLARKALRESWHVTLAPLAFDVPLDKNRRKSKLNALFSDHACL